MVKMSEKEYKKYLLFKQTYGLTEEVFWQFRNEVKVKRLKSSDLDGNAG
jgi:hypothetical protein